MARAGELFVAAAAGCFIEVDHFHYIPSRPGRGQRNLAIVVCCQRLLPLVRAGNGDFAFGQWLTEKMRTKALPSGAVGTSSKSSLAAVSARPTLAY
jgi:hypothetical protein